MGREQGTSNQTAQQATAKLAQAPSTSERGLSTGQPQFPSFSQHVHLLGSLPDALPLPYALASAHTVTSAGNVPSATFTFSHLSTCVYCIPVGRVGGPQHSPETTNQAHLGDIARQEEGP